MNTCLLVVFSFALVVVVCAAPLEDLDKKWDDFKQKHNRNYGNIEEENRRKEIFRKNVEGIEEHNRKYATKQVTFQQEINDFTDLTKEEISARLGFKPKGNLVDPNVRLTYVI